MRVGHHQVEPLASPYPYQHVGSAVSSQRFVGPIVSGSLQAPQLVGPLHPERLGSRKERIRRQLHGHRTVGHLVRYAAGGQRRAGRHGQLAEGDAESV